jgi:hypothetical protein
MQLIYYREGYYFAYVWNGKSFDIVKKQTTTTTTPQKEKQNAGN